MWLLLEWLEFESWEVQIGLCPWWYEDTWVLASWPFGSDCCTIVVMTVHGINPVLQMYP